MPSELPGFAEGAWWVQDAAASLPVRLLGDIAGKRVADLCAAPGGKTLQLAAAGARVTAVDISARRMTRLGDNLARAGLSGDTWEVAWEVAPAEAGAPLFRGLAELIYGDVSALQAFLSGRRRPKDQRRRGRIDRRRRVYWRPREFRKPLWLP